MEAPRKYLPIFVAEASEQLRAMSEGASQERELTAAEQTARLIELMHQNTTLTELTKELGQRIETLTGDLHCQLIKAAK